MRWFFIAFVYLPEEKEQTTPLSSLSYVRVIFSSTTSPPHPTRLRYPFAIPGLSISQHFLLSVTRTCRRHFWSSLLYEGMSLMDNLKGNVLFEKSSIRAIFVHTMVNWEMRGVDFVFSIFLFHFISFSFLFLFFLFFFLFRKLGLCCPRHEEKN